jgi:hypothetical protein
VIALMSFQDVVINPGVVEDTKDKLVLLLECWMHKARHRMCASNIGNDKCNLKLTRQWHLDT